MISVAKWHGQDVLGVINDKEGILENCMRFTDYPSPAIEYFSTSLGRTFGLSKSIDIPLEELTELRRNEQLKLDVNLYEGLKML